MPETRGGVSYGIGLPGGGSRSGRRLMQAADRGAALDSPEVQAEPESGLLAKLWGLVRSAAGTMSTRTASRRDR